MTSRPCRHVLNEKAGEHPKATRLVLACLNHLRSLRLTAILSGSKSQAAQEVICWHKVSQFHHLIEQSSEIVHLILRLRFMQMHESQWPGKCSLEQCMRSAGGNRCSLAYATLGYVRDTHNKPSARCSLQHE